MKKKWLLLLLAAAGLGAHAQRRLPPNYHWQRLDNGLEVVVIENHKVPLATIEIAVKNGAYTEGPEYSGLSHLFEHMFFKANQDYPDQEKFLRRTEELGAIWNGTTNVERVNYFFTFDKDSLEAGLRFMNSAMRYPIYRAEDMAKERPVVDGEFQRGESNPGFLIWHETHKRLWGDLFTRKNPIGEHDIINTATPEKMMVIKDKYYHPNNSLLIIAGDVQPAEAFAYARKVWGDWKHSGFNPIEKYPIPDFKPLQRTEYFIKKSSIANTPYLMFAWQGPSYRDDSANTVVADVFAAIMRLNASKWQQSLVDKGLATGADFLYTTNHYTGPIEAWVLPSSSKVKECYTEVMNQISQLGNPDYFTDAQLWTAREVIRRDQVRSREKPSSLPSQLSYQWASTSLEYYTDYEANLMRVTREDLARYAQRYIIGKPYVAGLILNEETAKALQPETFFKN